MLTERKCCTSYITWRKCQDHITLLNKIRKVSQHYPLEVKMLDPRQDIANFVNVQEITPYVKVVQVGAKQIGILSTIYLRAKLTSETNAIKI